jgi:2-iminobutanoate/2-iminopropanoate deaminase
MGERRSISIDGLTHLAAIPVATRIGPLLVSSVITAFDPGTRNVPPTIEAQITNLFTHVGAILEAAGGTWDDVAKMSFWLADPAHRSVLEQPWQDRFPDPDARPSRHTHIDPGATVATCDVLAYLSTGSR